MADNEPQPGEGLTYSDNISLSWKPADHDLDQTHRQPFYLDLLSALASAANDSENQLTRRIRRDGGVPLGVPWISRLHLPWQKLLCRK